MPEESTTSVSESSSAPTLIPKTKKIIFAALILALRIVLSRFLSIKTPLMKLSFGFVPTMLCATWLGPKWTILINLLDDLIGAILFPSGAFFIGYTISAVLAGLIYALFLYRKTATVNYKSYVIRVVLAIVVVTVFINLGLNTLWTSITAGQAFLPLLVARAYKQLITAPVHIVIFLAIEALLRKPLDRILREPVDAEEA